MSRRAPPITTAELITSAASADGFPAPGPPEIAFLGRSNVGKSSLLNSLLQRKGLARTSNTPGRTQSINFFLINESFYFVDLPGYGFAKVSKSMRSDWGKMAEEYLSQREQLALSIQLVDSRHKPSQLDLQLHEWLEFNQKDYLVVATKTDKLSSNELTKQIRLIETNMPESKIISYSAQSGKGRDSVWSEIATALK
jgi:GTP-binding protein